MITNSSSVPVSLDNIEKISKALGVQPKDLLDFTTIGNCEQKK